ncbi:ATP-binding cassette domain-containing protein [Acinetobacter sp. KS-LM10]|uniref:ATP-binding cassette domain-containing protein n=1 Tax=Acinetobacter sp. KS-LM10 TaxID=3120518 RepID=UPI0030D58D49
MTEQACVVSNLSLDFPNKSIFQNLNFSLSLTQKSALIGRNGQGKSLLMQILHQHDHTQMSYRGDVQWQVQHLYLSQLQRLDFSQSTTIADILDVQNILPLFKRVENGSASFSDYEQLEHQWHLPQLWEKQLADANLPTDLDFKVEHLSEGQKTKLALCHLFSHTDHYLLLDEPSNHLDAESRQWLIRQIHQHPSGLLIISHDRVLLQEVDHIYALNQIGLQHISGNYDDYKDFIDLKTNALEHSIDQRKRDLKSIKNQQNEQRLKMQKRSEQAKKLRQSGSQPKMVLNAKRSQAEHSLSSIQKQQSRQIEQIQSDLSTQKNEYEILKQQRFFFHQHQFSTGEILRIKNLKLPFGSTHPIHFSLNADQKIHLRGKNGSGKSTLLQIIQKSHSSGSEHIYLKAHLAYLEQHLAILDSDLNAVENLMNFNDSLSPTEWRNLLGQLRIRGDLSMLSIAQLSGGEKLKVILLGMSHSKTPIDLLLLDEPENHLDIDSRNLLAQAIRSFNGAVILVSHDPEFILNCGIQENYDLTH